MIETKELFSKSSNELDLFRSKVIQENGADPDLISTPYTHNEITQKMGFNEDVYKFSFSKWEDTYFDRLLVLTHKNEIISFCGFKIYFQKFLRIGMHYYTLKSHRRLAFSALWKKGGYLDYLYCDYKRFDGMFLTVFPHNRKLESIAKSMGTGRRHQIDTEMNRSPYLHLFKCLPEKYRFNNVDQYIVFHSPQNKAATSLLANF